jgi:gliding motility-associated-like protein
MRYLLTLLFTLSICFGFSQNRSRNWYFGSNAGIQFNNAATPTVLTNGALDTLEGCASISNNSGDLLFYTDGRTIWNRLHQIMPNGSGLLGDSSSTNSGLIIPQPGNNNLYYVFSLDENGKANGLRYSVVDMSLDNNLGDVNAEKNILLYTPSTEKLTAITHSNGTDVWLISHRHQTNEFISHLITSSGINLTPIVSSIGSVPINSADTVGAIKASPDGTKIAMVSFGLEIIEIFDLNNTTGIVSNIVTISKNDLGFSGLINSFYGLEFSPSGSVLYVSAAETGIFQFDLTNYNYNSILNSAILLPIGSLNPISNKFGALQLGFDGKIYAANKNRLFLGVINSPETLGTGCNYNPDGIYLDGKICNFGLPPFIQSYFGANIIADNLCFGDTTTFSLYSTLNYDTVLWEFGDGTTSTLNNPTHTYFSTGNYIVKVTITVGLNTTQTTLNINIDPALIANQPDNLVVCDDDLIDGFASFNLLDQDASILNGLNPSDYFITYHDSEMNALTNTNSINPTYVNVTNPETIYARLRSITNSNCFAITNFQLIVNEKPELTVADSFSICNNQPVFIQADLGFDSYLWSTGETTSAISVSTPGTYTLNVTKTYGNLTCSTSKQINVVASASATIINIDVTDWSATNNSITIYVEGNGDYEYSIDGINYQNSNTFSNLDYDEYTAYVRDKNGCDSIEKEVLLLFYPNFFTPNNDGFNDYWQLYNVDKESNLSILIFNRYGKLLKQLSPTSNGWDGTYLGKPLPTEDYWFQVIRENGKTFTGHFTLKR